MIRKLIYNLILIAFILFKVNAQPNMKFEWIRTGSGSQFQTATSIALDNNNVIVAGTFTGIHTTLGNNYITLYNSDSSGLSSNFFIAKYNQTGEVIWSKAAYCKSGTSSNKIFTDNNGNIYACGFINQGNSVDDIISFDSINFFNHGGARSFLTKYSPQGISQWTLFTRSNFFGYDTISTIKWDGTSTAVILGGFCLGDSVTVGNLNIINTGNNLYSSFIAKINSQTGNVDWIKNTTGSSFKCKINNLVLDTAGNIYAAGAFLGNFLIFEYDTLQNSNPAPGNQYLDGYIAKLNSNGSLIWIDKGVCTTNDEVTSISLYKNQLIVGGTNSSQINLGGFIIPPFNYLAEYNLQGDLLNAFYFPATVKVIHPYQNRKGFILGGIFTNDSLYLGNMAFGKHNGSSLSNSNIFVSLSDSIGFYSYAITAGGISSSFLNDLTVGDSNKIYISGAYNSSIYFDTTQYIANGMTELFFAKLDTGILSAPIPKYNLGGTVFVGNVPVDFAIAYLYNLNFQVIDTCIVDSLGFYHFYQVQKGNYKVSTDLIAQSIYFNQNYIQTFYPNKIAFTEADTIILNSTKWGKDIHLQSITYIQEIDRNSFDIQLYPNPAIDKVCLVLKNFIPGNNYSLKVFNSNGNTVYVRNNIEIIGKTDLDIKSFNPGLYIIQLTDSQGNSSSIRFIKSE